MSLIYVSDKIDYVLTQRKHFNKDFPKVRVPNILKLYNLVLSLQEQKMERRVMPYIAKEINFGRYDVPQDCKITPYIDSYCTITGWFSTIVPFIWDNESQSIEHYFEYILRVFKVQGDITYERALWLFYVSDTFEAQNFDYLKRRIIFSILFFNKACAYIHVPFAGDTVLVAATHNKVYELVTDEIIDYFDKTIRKFYNPVDLSNTALERRFAQFTKKKL